MVKSRQKGHALERKIAEEFRKLGFKDCKTSRYASKMRDDELVDLVGTEPFNVQIKAWERAPSYHDILSNMPDDGVNVIIHKRNRKGEVVVMRKEDFYNLIKNK